MITRFLPAIIFLMAQSAAPAQEAPPGDPLKEPESTAQPGVTPMSDKEETGAMSDLLPGQVEPFALPMESGPEAVTLFPPELWPPVPSREAASYQDPLLPAVTEGRALPPDFLNSGLSATPSALQDPQSLLAEASAAPLRALLEQSLNNRGGFKIALVLLGGSQQVPVDIDFNSLLARWFGDSKGALVIYYAGHPERTLAWFSKAAREHHGDDNLRMVIDLGMKEALRHTFPLPQFQRFCVKTAIRLDRLHRQGEVSPSDESPVTAPERQQDAAPSSAWWALAIGIQLAGLAAAALWFRRRRRAKQPGESILLPPQECTPRLGGQHSGGFGAVLSFGHQSARR